MAFRLIPREERFFDDFVALAEQIQKGAALLEEMLAPERPIWDKADEIKEVEHKCDFITHEIIQRLHRTFVTPLDREDIHTLARTLDDVMDAIDASARDRPALPDRARSGPTRASSPGSSRCPAQQVVIALKALERRTGSPSRRSRSIASRTKPIGRTRTPCAACSRRNRIPSTIIKWKEILDFLEAATDRCEDVANVLEGVVVKHA